MNVLVTGGKPLGGKKSLSTRNFFPGGEKDVRISYIMVLL